MPMPSTRTRPLLVHMESRRICLASMLCRSEWMREAYTRTRKDGATGIDGVTAQDYEANLRDLLERVKSGRYKAPPVRRTYIPKADGSQRRSASRHSKTRPHSEQSRRYWRPSTNRTFSHARAVSGRGGRHTRRCDNCQAPSRCDDSTGCSTSTCASTSTRFRTHTCAKSSTSE
jgi:hypothetical protein